MNDHDEKQDQLHGAKLNRRNFIGAMGAAAAAGALLETIGGGGC